MKRTKAASKVPRNKDPAAPVNTDFDGKKECGKRGCMGILKKGEPNKEDRQLAPQARSGHGPQKITTTVQLVAARRHRSV